MGAFRAYKQMARGSGDFLIRGIFCIYRRSHKNVKTLLVMFWNHIDNCSDFPPCLGHNNRQRTFEQQKDRNCFTNISKQISLWPILPFIYLSVYYTVFSVRHTLNYSNWVSILFLRKDDNEMLLRERNVDSWLPQKHQPKIPAKESLTGCRLQVGHS